MPLGKMLGGLPGLPGLPRLPGMGKKTLPGLPGMGGGGIPGLPRLPGLPGMGGDGGGRQSPPFNPGGEEQGGGREDFVRMMMKQRGGGQMRPGLAMRMGGGQGANLSANIQEQAARRMAANQMGSKQQPSQGMFGPMAGQGRGGGMNPNLYSFGLARRGGGGE